MDPNDFLEAFTEFVKAIVQAETASLRGELEFIKSLQDEWVSQKEAMKILGVKTPGTMKTRRESKHTLIKVQQTSSKTYIYSRASLLEENIAKTRKRIVGRILPMPPQID